jgi:competence protein ComEC
MAVISIVFLYQRLKFLFEKSTLFRKFSEYKLGDFLGKLFLMTLAAQLGTLPLVAYYFHRFSIISFLMNLLVIPLLGIIIALGLLSLFFSLFSISLAQFYANTNTIILDSLVQVLEQSVQFKFSAIEISQMGLVTTLLYYFLLLIIINLDKKICRKALVFSTLIIILLSAWQPIFENGKWMKVIFFDVGQGDAALVTFPDGKNLLIDSGPCFENFDAGKTFIIPYLKRERIRQLDAVILTHSDVDHVGGMPSIFRSLQVNQVYDNGIYQSTMICTTYSHVIDSLDLPLERIYAGRRLKESEHLGLFILHPTRSFIETNNVDFNNSSIVLKINYGKISFLFAGDIEVESETFLLNYGNLLQANVLKIPHHGSRTSSSLELLQCVAPEYAVISVGRNNQFNLPDSEILTRLNNLGIKAIRTDVNGAVIFRTDGIRLERIR